MDTLNSVADHSHSARRWHDRKLYPVLASQAGAFIGTVFE